MSRQELKMAINEILEETPDVVLNEVLNYLNTVKDKTEETIISSQNINNILREDKELLERLSK